ncbi:MAG: phosphatidylserine decarboxylase [Planctomycetes bacterium]|nr:phosphatidylserine decarboxylase [Planctomycetota bacterium]
MMASTRDFRYDTILGVVSATSQLIIRQISGAIARRIVCRAEKGAILNRGQRFGMIKFGSRTELYLPVTPDLTVAVQIGDHVSAGSTVMARVAQPARTIEPDAHKTGQEIADAIICADLLCWRLGINFGEAIVERFNANAEKHGSTVRLGE